MHQSIPDSSNEHKVVERVAEAFYRRVKNVEALAGRLQGCLYRADMQQQECEALLVDFPDQEKELRKLSTWR